MAHFNFVISQNTKWGHAGFYIDCHWMTVPENILLQKKHCKDLCNKEVSGVMRFFPLVDCELLSIYVAIPHNSRQR